MLDGRLRVATGEPAPDVQISSTPRLDAVGNAIVFHRNQQQLRFVSDDRVQHRTNGVLEQVISTLGIFSLNALG